MALNLENLSPRELQTVIAEAQSRLESARSNLVQDVRKKIDALLNISGLTLVEVYPSRSGKKATGKKGPVASKYRDPSDPTKTWSGRGKRPLWFVAAIKKRGVTAESLLIESAGKKLPAKATTKKKTTTKRTSRA